MTADPDRAVAAILPPALLDLLRGRALTLARPVWGQRGGRHRAARAGLGHLFRAHRAYVPGDDPRHLDWRAMARRDRPMIRQTEGEDELSLVALVDLAGGMAYGEGESRKHRTSAALVAALAHLAIRQGDRVGFATGGDGRIDGTHLRPAGGAPRLQALAEALADPPLRGACPWLELVAAAAPRLPRRSLVVAASDLLDPCPDDDPDVADALEADLWAAFAGLRARGHDVVLLRVLHPDELDPPWPGGELLRIVDPQGVHADLEGMAAALREGYRARFAAHREALARHCEGHGIHLLEVRSDAPLADALLEILARLSGMPAPADAAPSPDPRGRR
jgi:uncharacterized protein (DUF58 family)